MAKKKKGHKKRNKHKSVGKNTTIQPVPTEQHNATSKDIKAHNKIVDPSSKKHREEISDVRYSLIIFGAILAVFVILYVVLKNHSISTVLYGIIKL